MFGRDGLLKHCTRNIYFVSSNRNQIDMSMRCKELLNVAHASVYSSTLRGNFYSNQHCFAEIKC